LKASSQSSNAKISSYRIKHHFAGQANDSALRNASLYRWFNSCNNLRDHTNLAKLISGTNNCAIRCA
jgi:hypothetical protein